MSISLDPLQFDFFKPYQGFTREALRPTNFEGRM